MKKPLSPQEFMEKSGENRTSIPHSEIPQQSDHLACPYDKCGKRFEQPVVLTDLSKTPRETYYACPNCFSRLEIAFKSQENMKSVSVKASENEDVKPPQECSRYLGYLTTLQKEDSLPDECLTCPKLIQCTVKR